MHATDMSMRKIALGFTTAMTAVLLIGCASNSAPRANVSASAAQADPSSVNHERAVQQAEAAVAADPHNAVSRMALGNAYLDAGRFASAETAFADAMALGDTSARAGLAMALAQIAQAKYSQATELLNDYDGQIARADLGLALALAGQPDRGIHVMSNAIRGGENTVKMRQNLAYAYAMAGRWREARLMAAQDVPAGEVGARLEQWAGLAPSEAYQHRVAALLGVPTGVADSGQPLHLALGNAPPVQQVAAQAVSAPVPAPVAQPEFAELPSVRETAVREPAPRSVAPAPAATEFAAAFAPAEIVPSASRLFSEPVVQAAPAQRAVSAPQRPARPQFSDQGRSSPAPVRASADGTHLVQLGSFLSEAGAQRAWNVYVGRYPELAGREMVITEAVVRGRHYWRVSAGGFDQLASRAMCNRVRSNGSSGCITWTASRPVPGAVDSGLRLARR